MDTINKLSLKLNYNRKCFSYMASYNSHIYIAKSQSSESEKQYDLALAKNALHDYFQTYNPVIDDNKKVRFDMQMSLVKSTALCKAYKDNVISFKHYVINYLMAHNQVLQTKIRDVSPNRALDLIKQTEYDYKRII